VFSGSCQAQAFSKQIVKYKNKPIFSQNLRGSTVKKLRYSWIFVDQTFLRLGLGKLFPAKESLVSDIPAGDGNVVSLFLQCG